MPLRLAELCVWEEYAGRVAREERQDGGNSAANTSASRKRLDFGRRRGKEKKRIAYRFPGPLQRFPRRRNRCLCVTPRLCVSQCAPQGVERTSRPRSGTRRLRRGGRAQEISHAEGAEDAEAPARREYHAESADDAEPWAPSMRMTRRRDEKTTEISSQFSGKSTAMWFCRE